MLQFQLIGTHSSLVRRFVMQRTRAVFISYIVSYASKRWCYIARRRKFFARTKCIKKCIEAAARFTARVSEASRLQLQLRCYSQITIAAAARTVRAQQVHRTSLAQSRKDCIQARVHMVAGMVQGTPQPAPGGATNCSSNSQHC